MPRFSITTFNARWGLAIDDQPFDLASCLAEFDTDVIALQEVWDPTDRPGEVEAAARALGYEVVHVALSGSTIDPTPQIVAEPERVEGTWGIALLSRLSVASVRIVDLGRLIERWDVANRSAIVATLDVGGAGVSVSALHLSFALPNAVAQLRRLDTFLPTHLPSLVAGDCNLWGPLAASLLHRHERSVRGRTWPAHRPHSQLDHLLVSPELQLVSGAVGRPVGSDHLPVSATFDVLG